MIFRKCLAFACALLGFLATAWVVPAAQSLDSAVERSPLSCFGDCARVNEGCLRGCASGEEGDACRASCARSDAECRQSCEKVRASTTVELSDAWVCSGPVDECSSPDHSGSYGCAYAAGSGSTARKARSAARDDCQDQLSTAHGGSFACKGLAQLDCHERD